MSFNKDLPDRDTIEELNSKEPKDFKPTAGRYRMIRFIAIIAITAFVVLILGRAL